MPRIGILGSSLPEGLGTGLYGALAFSCTATGEERYFCCPLDRCGLAPASHTVSPRSGKDPSPPQVRPASSLRPGRSNITSGVRPSLYPGPMPQGILMYTTGLYVRNLIPDDTSNPSSASPGRSEWGYAELCHNGVLGSSPAGRNKPGCVTDLVQPYLYHPCFISVPGAVNSSSVFARATKITCSSGYPRSCRLCRTRPASSCLRH